LVFGRDWAWAGRVGRSAGLRMAGFALSLSIAVVVDVIVFEGCVVWLLGEGVTLLRMCW
jgi:hypothetical protein